MDGVTDDKWQYLDDDVISVWYRTPPGISLMRTIAVVAEYVRALEQGDVPMEEESSNEEEESDEDIESEEDE